MKLDQLRINPCVLRATLNLGLFVLLFLVFLLKVYELDIWYHLSIGREIWNSASIPDSEFLVYPNAGMPMVFHEWGFALLVYLTHSAFGFDGLSALNALILATTTFLFFVASRASGVGLPARIIGVAMLVWSISISRYLRPEIILYICLAAEVFFLELYTRSNQVKWLFPLPFIALALTQAHPSVIFLLFVLACYGLNQLWATKDDHPALLRQLKILLTCGLAMILFGSLNPYGLSQVLEPLYFGSQDDVLSVVLEFLPALESTSRNLFLTLSALGAFALIVDRRRLALNLPYILAFAYLAYSYQRNIVLFAIILCIPVVRSLSILVNKGQDFFKQKGLAADRLIPVVFLGAAVLLLIGVSYQRIGFSLWGMGVNEDQHPSLSAKVINAVQPSGNIFNYYDFGGYLGWKLNGDYQVFIDGRNNRKSKTLDLHRQIASANVGWETKLTEFDINTVVVPTMIMVTGEMPPIINELTKSNEWILAATGYRELLFFRRSAMPPEVLFGQLSKDRVWRQIGTDASMHIRHTPQVPGYYLSFGRAAKQLGMKQQAIQAYTKYLQLVPNDTNAKFEMMELL